jgi:hypothetical protein
MPPKYKQVREQGIRFLFKYDDAAPDLLHIFARHLMEIDDALDLFFDTKPEWNEAYERFENYSETAGLYWFWLEEGNAVMVISCFRV